MLALHRAVIIATSMLALHRAVITASSMLALHRAVELLHASTT